MTEWINSTEIIHFERSSSYNMLSSVLPSRSLLANAFPVYFSMFVFVSKYQSTEGIFGYYAIVSQLLREDKLAIGK